MRVGIDAKWYFEGPASGKMVIRNIVNELSRKSNEIEFFFILDKKFKNESIDFETDQTNKIFIWSGNNLLSNVFVVPYYARKHKLDVILYQNSVSCFGRHKKIAYIHDLIYITHPQYYTLIERIYLKPLKFLTRFSDFIVTVSNFEKTRFRALNFSSKDVEVLHHGADPIFKPKAYFDENILNNVIRKYNLPARFILYVGRINTRKNVPNLIKAFKKMNTDDIELVLVGNKEWKTDDIDSLLKENDLYHRVIQTGPLHGEELAAVYSLATVFCFPSFEESFGLPPLEAMASGVPVVVSNTSSIPEVCGDAAVYVNAQDTLEIAESLKNLLSDEIKMVENVSKGFQRSKELTWKNSSEKFIHILKERYGA